MNKTRKRVTISIAGSLLADIDRSARELRESRSAVIEGWLREGVEQRARVELDQEIERYYQDRPEHERLEGEVMVRAAARAAARLTFDDRGPKRPRKKPSEPR